VETGVVVSPPCRWQRRYWEEDTYVLIPEDGLRPNTTYLISVSSSIEDAHGVPMEGTFVTGFSTGRSLDAGEISGRIGWKKMDVEEAMVEL
jgi:hypothetical protein